MASYAELISDVDATLYFASASSTSPAVKLLISTTSIALVVNVVLPALTNLLSPGAYTNTSSNTGSPGLNAVNLIT